MVSEFEQLPVFVYGTLQRGEQRSSLWPCRPLAIQWATIRARLHDMRDYPALVEGADRILGELWSFAAGDLPLTLRTLDAIEGFAQADDDLYIRRVVECATLAGEASRAYTYFYAKPAEVARTPSLAAGSSGLVHWRCLNPNPPDVG